MKINFTIFNDCQEHYEWDSDILGKDEELMKFIISKDPKSGIIDIMPVILYKKIQSYGGPFLTKI